MSSPILPQLLVSTLVAGVTVLIHLAGLVALIALMRMHSRLWMTGSRRLNDVVLVLGAGFGLFVLHTVEIWLYAVVYVAVHAVADFEDALYFATSAYATLGSTVTLAREWRIVGAIEGANGVILLGWSTAFFVSVVQRLRALEHDWLEAPRLESRGPRPPP